MKIKNALKIVIPVFATSMISLPLSACAKSSGVIVKVENVKFNQEYSYVEIGATRSFSKEVKITPENATNKSLTYSLSDVQGGDIADINPQTGDIKGKAVGYGKLKCVSVDDPTKSSEQWIIVGDYVPLTDFKLNETTKTVYLNEKDTEIPTTFLPSNATAGKYNYIKWESSNTSVATINEETGKIKAISEGQTTISATPYDYDDMAKDFVLKENLKKQCLVTVAYRSPESIIVNPQKIVVEKEQKFLVQPKILPVSAKQEWGVAITPEGFATYDPTTNQATAGNKSGDGKIIFIAKADQTKTAICNVHIVEEVIPVTDIKFDESTKTLTQQDTWTPSITVTGEGGKTPSETGYYFTSSDEQCLAVDSTNPNQVKAIKKTEEGKPVILTVHSNDQKHTGTCSVTINENIIKVNQIKLPSVATVKTGNTLKLEPTVLPENATDKSVSYSSSDINVATVSAEGIVTGIKVGTAKITCTAKDGSEVSATCTITVQTDYIEISSISIPDRRTIKLSEYVQGQDISAEVFPTTATQKRVQWKIQEDKKDLLAFKVKDDLTLTYYPLKAGTVEIWAEAENGKIMSNHCTVTIEYDPVTEVQLGSAQKTINVGDSLKLYYKVLPDTADQSVTWSSSDPQSVSVDATGVVNGLKECQNVVITCTSAADLTKKATCMVTVNKKIIKPTKITIEPKTMTVEIWSKHLFPQYTIVPAEASETDVAWGCNDPDALQTGPEYPGFYANKEGTYQLQCISTVDPTVMGICTVTVTKVHAESVQFTSYPRIIHKGDKMGISAKVLPAEAYQDVEYESKNPGILKVITEDNKTKVEGVSEGTAEISAWPKGHKELAKSVKIIVSPYVSFVKDTWANICEIKKQGGIQRLYSYYSIDCQANKQFPGTLIGYERTMNYNNLLHNIRVIGIGSEKGSYTSETLITFELTGLLTDNAGNAIRSTAKMISEYQGHSLYNSEHLNNLNNHGHRPTWSKYALTVLGETDPPLVMCIKHTKKTYRNPKGETEQANLKLFPPTIATIHPDYVSSEGKLYPYYEKFGKDPSSRIKKTVNGTGYAVKYWTSSFMKDYTHFFGIDTNGNAINLRYEENLGICFCFCV